MHLAILSGGDGWHVRDLIRAAGELGCETTILDFRTLASGVAHGPNALEGFDAILVRTMPHGSLEQVVFRMDLLHLAEAAGVTVLNPPRSLEVCIDKFLCSARLERAGLPVPQTVACQDADSAMTAFHELGGDVVVKPLFGSEGRGMLRVHDAELAWRTFRTLERLEAVLYVQEFVRHPGWDLRLFILGGEVLAAMKRTGEGDWRTNVAQGARAEAHAPSRREHELALKATTAVGAVMAGVDLLYGPDGAVYVIEVNAVPGWRTLAPTTGIDVAGRLIRHTLQIGSRE
jgi:RimK family alpha-L-glutamate ligase